MPIEILMPALSPTMTEGNLANWKKKEGDKVKAGDVIAEIETDKATMEVEAVDEGVLGKILVAAGTENVKVNEAIALLLEDGEDKKALESYKVKGNLAPPAKGEETEKEAPGQKSEEVKSEAAPQPKVEPQKAVSQDLRIKASPLAKRISQQEGVDLRNIKGSGPHGRVLKEDVLGAMKDGIGGLGGGIRRHQEKFKEIPNNNMRKVIARRLTESRTDCAAFLSFDRFKY